MKHLKFTLLIATLGLSACDSINDMKGLLAKQGIAQDFVKEEYGIDSQIGFNFDNGIFTQVSLVISADDVREKSIDELEVIAKKMAAHTFDSKPQAIYIQLAIKPDSTP